MRQSSIQARAIVLFASGLLFWPVRVPAQVGPAGPQPRTDLLEESNRPPQKLDPVIQKIVSEISEQRVADIMRRLGDFQTRNTVSDPTQTNRGIGAARQ